MNLAEYKRMFDVEESYWWYIGMRRIMAQTLHAALKPGIDHPRLLDAGCGTGGMLATLQNPGLTVGIDLSEEALTLTDSRSIQNVRLARSSIADLPFPEDTFDIVICFDVLCCLQDDVRALQEYCRVLKPGGFLLLSVPAFEFLRGQHDAAVYIIHRYTAPDLNTKLQAAGLRVERLSYANTILLPLAFLVRLLRTKPNLDTEHSTSDLMPLPKPINWLFTKILLFEAALLRKINLPFGVTLLTLARKQ